jgi:cell division protease FtsH
LFVAAGLLLAVYWTTNPPGREEIGYGKFRRLVKEGKVAGCVLKPDKIEGELTDKGKDGKPGKFFTRWSRNDREIYALLDAAPNKPSYSESNDRLWNMLLWAVILAVPLFILWRLLFSGLNPAGSVMKFAQSRAKLFMKTDVGVTFEDVAGIDECKEELQEIIEFLENPKKFTSLGGKIPRGVLIVGAPGTGKTLLAKAVAGEAGVPFFSLSGSDFVEMFVGVGAARVRDLFETANAHAPCIIFIDEMDALGKTRGLGALASHDEREQTLNALLVQMDGFETTKGIIILAATNRPEMLDPALLRPGRFDRQIAVPRPDLEGREQILKLHCRGVKVAAGVDLRKIAALTPGFVGADLANLVNEAALLAARRGKNEVPMSEFEDAIERVVAGLQRRSRLINPEEKKIVAFHEAGHAMLACLLPGADPVRKVSVVARGVAGLGYTMQMPLEDRYLMRKGELVDRLTVMLGGRAAEEVIFREISTGAHNDLQKATELAREMVTSFGMSEEVGPLAFPREQGPAFLPEAFAARPYSEQTSREIDKAIKDLMLESYGRAKRLLAEHQEALKTVASALMEKEVLDQEELRSIVSKFGIELPAEKLPSKLADKTAEPELARTDPPSRQ